MKSHTGTPWSVFDPEEHGCKGYLEVVHADEGQHKVICEVIDHDNDRENAALIAAAPEMLKALKSAKWMLERDFIDPQKLEIIRKCDAAIEAAEGAE